MNWFFDKKFIYNWSVNPANPGLADFFLFLVKYSIVGALVVTMFLPVDGVVAAAMIWAAAMEEQALVFWVYHANQRLKAGLKFAILFSLVEFVAKGVTSDSFASYAGFIEMVSIRTMPSISHLLSALLAYVLIERRIPVFRVWLICASLHYVYNLYVTHFF